MAPICEKLEINKSLNPTLLLLFFMLREGLNQPPPPQNRRLVMDYILQPTHTPKNITTSCITKHFSGEGGGPNRPIFTPLIKALNSNLGRETPNGGPG